MIKDLHSLPKVRDSISYLYVEHCRIDQEAKAIAIVNENGKTPIPCASLTVLMVGPGTTMTHAAIKTLADCGCLVVWCGEEGVRFYAEGLGETRRSTRMMHQARVWADEKAHMDVVMRMYRMRFREPIDSSLTLEQLRGLEGIRVREAYRTASKETGVAWEGRSYNRNNWKSGNPINRALSAANSCIYGICHAAIISAGFSPALGFIHTGKMTSFVYDIADLYKAETTIPASFFTVAEGEYDIESRVRHFCRDSFRESKMLKRIIPDIEYALGLRIDDTRLSYLDEEVSSPAYLWDPKNSEIESGVNYSDSEGVSEDGRDST